MEVKKGIFAQPKRHKAECDQSSSASDESEIFSNRGRPASTSDDGSHESDSESSKSSSLRSEDRAPRFSPPESVVEGEPRARSEECTAKACGSLKGRTHASHKRQVH